MLLITGTGRSGTHFTSRLLAEMGYDVPHEDIGRDGCCSWKHITSGTFVYVGKNRSKEIVGEKFTRTLHQVRHPLKVISSMQTFGDSTWGYMAQHIPLDMRANKIRRGMQAWVAWNGLIQQRADWRFQIERLGDLFEEFCLHAGLPVQPMPDVPHAAKDSRTKRYRQLTWRDLQKNDEDLAEMVRKLGIEYGYEDISQRDELPRKRGWWQLFGR